MKCVPDIEFDPVNGLAFDLYLPDDLRASACVLYAHGGGFRKGSRDEPEAGYFAQPLTDAGFAVASVSYRLNAPADVFDTDDQDVIEAYAARTAKVGITIAPHLYGAPAMAAMEDLSKAIEYLWVEGERLGIKHRKVGVLGVSAGGIAGLTLAYPPKQWVRRVSRPDAVVTISSTFIQPWRLEPDGPPCLMIHGKYDRIIDDSNVDLSELRANQVGAPVTILRTGVAGHATQVDEVLDGADAHGTPYMQLIIDQFARLKDD